MKKNVKRVIAFIISAIGTVAIIYVAGYLMFFKPIFSLYHGLRTGNITAFLLFSCLIRLFFCTTVAGAIWCFFDIVAGFFRDNDDPD